jgi:hypothetical protein
MLAIRPEHTRVKHLSGAPLQGRPLALPTKIRQGWKGLPRTNTLAYYGIPYIAAIKIFIVRAPLANVIKLFTAVSYDFS